MQLKIYLIFYAVSFLLNLYTIFFLFISQTHVMHFRLERERLERERAEVLKLEREKQRLERERLEREKLELRKRTQLTLVLS